MNSKVEKTAKTNSIFKKMSLTGAVLMGLGGMIGAAFLFYLVRLGPLPDRQFGYLFLLPELLCFSLVIPTVN